MQVTLCEQRNNTAAHRVQMSVLWQYLGLHRSRNGNSAATAKRSQTPSQRSPDPKMPLDFVCNC